MSVVNERVLTDNSAWGEALRGLLNREMWAWFDENRDRRLVTVRKWFFSFSVRVRDLEPLFVTLFGPRPSTSGS